MRKAKIISALFTVGMTLPIWFYLMYQILARVNATDVMWLLFWVYVPLTFITAFVTKLAED
jgi:hypothetical protein